MDDFMKFNVIKTNINLPLDQKRSLLLQDLHVRLSHLGGGGWHVDGQTVAVAFLRFTIFL